MAPHENANLFTSSPDWAAYVAANPEVIPPDVAPPIDFTVITAQREDDARRESAWAATHPPQNYGYQKSSKDIGSARIPVVIYLPTGHSEANPPLPILFVTHGGGYIFGSPVTDEQWFLYGLLSQIETRFAVVSVDYELAPEHPFPIAQEQCWAALQIVAHDTEAIFDIPNVDVSRIILAGCSAGAGLAANLAQRARDANMSQVIGAVLNVPMLCHPDVFPRTEFPQESYDQCRNGSESNLRAEHMLEMWDLYVPVFTADARGKASPFLSDTKGMVPHAIFVAGQDPLRDEGLAYAEKLRRDGVNVELRVYRGVPHNFGKIWELESRQSFHHHLVECVDWLLKSATNVPKR